MPLAYNEYAQRVIDYCEQPLPFARWKTKDEALNAAVTAQRDMLMSQRWGVGLATYGEYDGRHTFVLENRDVAGLYVAPFIPESGEAARLRFAGIYFPLTTREWPPRLVGPGAEGHPTVGLMSSPQDCPRAAYMDVAKMLVSVSVRMHEAAEFVIEDCGLRSPQ